MEWQPDELDLDYEEWRPTQVDAFSRIEAWMAGEADNFAVEAPTGTGKTGLALGHGYDRSISQGERTVICVATVHEQRQYTAAFRNPEAIPPWFASLSGRGRYICSITGKSEADSDPADDHRGCEYFQALIRAQQSEVLVVNYALARIGFMRGGDLFGAGWGTGVPFANMILDECHDIHSIMEDWFGFKMSDTDWKSYVWSEFGDFTPKFDFWKKYALSAELVDDIKGVDERLEAAEFLHYDNPTPDSRKEIKNLIRVQHNLSNLRVCVEREDVFTGEDRRVGLIPPFPPVSDASRFYGNASRRLFMSGTILSSESGFRRGVGVFDCDVSRMDNPFPPKNSPLYFIKGPSLAYKTRKPIQQVYRHGWGEIPNYVPVSTNTPEAIRILDAILDRNPGRVMVHAHSNLNAKTIGQFSDHRDRMLVHDSTDWDGMFKEYCRTPGAVLVAAGRTEAVDLPGDLCTCVVMYKLPFSPFSEVEKKRAEISPSYYTASMLQTIRQARGRGVRSVRDECPCYVIESNGKNYTRNSAFRGVLTKQVDPPPTADGTGKPSETKPEKALTSQAKLL